jgi:predicted Zn-dependent protease
MKSLYSVQESETLMTRSEAETIAKRVLSQAKGEETRVTITNGLNGNTRFALNGISTAGDDINTTVAIESTVGKKRGSFTTNKLDEASLIDALRTAELLATLAPENPEAMPGLGSQQYKAGRAVESVLPSAEARAAAVKKVTEPAAAAGLVATGFIETRVSAVAIANTRGLFAYDQRSDVSMTATVRTEDGRGSGWAGDSADSWGGIDAKAIGAAAIQKAKQSAGAKELEPGRYTAVLEPTAAANLIQLMTSAMNARSADEGRSFFSKQGGGTKLGMKVVDERVTIVSDPDDPEMRGDPFTGEGLPTERIVWIEKGVVKTLSYDRFWAQKMGMQPTRSPGSIRMSGGQSSVPEMIAKVEKGVLVTRFWYIRGVDPRTILYTGLTRDGTFLIENGKVTHPIKNFRYNESPVIMLNNLAELGRPVRVNGTESGGLGSKVVVPAVTVRDFTFSSLSDAV